MNKSTEAPTKPSVLIMKHSIFVLLVTLILVLVSAKECPLCDRQCATATGNEKQICLDRCYTTGKCDFPPACLACRKQCDPVQGVQEYARCLNACKASGGCNCDSCYIDQCRLVSGVQEYNRCVNACLGAEFCQGIPTSCDPCYQQCRNIGAREERNRCINACKGNGGCKK